HGEAVALERRRDGPDLRSKPVVQGYSVGLLLRVGKQRGMGISLPCRRVVENVLRVTRGRAEGEIHSARQRVGGAQERAPQITQRRRVVTQVDIYPGS